MGYYSIVVCSRRTEVQVSGVKDPALELVTKKTRNPGKTRQHARCRNERNLPLQVNR